MRFLLSPAVVGSLLLATLSTIADYIWFLNIPTHQVVSGLVHGASLFAALGLYLGWRKGQSAAGLVGGLLSGMLWLQRGNPFSSMLGGIVAALLLWRGTLYRSKWMLWILMLSLPFPYIANTAGWMTAELGRQPWLVYGLMRTADGYSKTVSAGNGTFTLLGFLGMYTVLGILFLFMVRREIENGPVGGPVSH